MKRIFYLCLFLTSLQSQHTFSIVAVDTITGEVGSAGATCLSINREGYEALIISKLHPGIGAIHTQSYWNSFNQDVASEMMLAGMNSQEIIDNLVQFDVDNNPSIRQYGIVHLNKNKQPDAAAYTGDNCLSEKKHKEGRFYSIQGNILLGEYIIDSMESRFLRSNGTLANRLMESMKGALVAGADARCLPEGISSRSSFLRVAKPNDSLKYFLDIHVPSTRAKIDPIDSLETLYKKWLKTQSIVVNKESDIWVHYFPQEKVFQIYGLQNPQTITFSLFNLDGREFSEIVRLTEDKFKLKAEPLAGIYILRIIDDLNKILVKKILIP
ncbi:MAG: DUF1028 domain-containing protein [Saprospiraceae bacterium]|nr:DUF1028 domain-containing protein [Saprospiraceae bacterium]